MGNYFGCYNDCGSLGRALPVGTGNGYTYDTCSQKAISSGYKYFGLQYTQPNGTSECWVGNDLNQGRGYGKAGNCEVLDGVTVGTYCSNAIYTTDSTEGSYYYVILQDDGNMCIHRGSSPDDDQGLIWASNTEGQQKDPNPLYKASIGKYGKNWMTSDSVLGPNEFIGSTDGSIYLLMQGDGNLVLYTSSSGSGCKNSAYKYSNGTYTSGGTTNVNAVYQMNNVGNTQLMESAGYIDQDAVLHKYPSSRLGLSNQISSTYDVITGYNTWGNDIPNAAYQGGTVDDCKKTCNEIKDCYGFVWDKNAGKCWPKTNLMYPYGGPIGENSDSDIYIKNNYDKISGYDTGGNDIPNAAYSGGTVDDCKKKCDGMSDCYGFVWDNDTQSCYPKNNLMYPYGGQLNEKDQDDTYIKNNYVPNPNNYSVTVDFNTWGNDLPNAAYTGGTIDECKNTCNNMEDCYGFVWEKDNSKCWPKNNQMYPYGGPIGYDSNSDIYFRNKTVTTPPSGVTNETIGIDSVQYQNYKKGDDISDISSFGLSNISQEQKDALNQKYSELTNLANQLNQTNMGLEGNTSEVIKQTLIDRQALDNYLLHYGNIDKRINNQINTTKNLDAILNDSDIVVLQENYNYLFWSILAAGTLLISMNVLNK
jgi:hypothetical protein